MSRHPHAEAGAQADLRRLAETLMRASPRQLLALDAVDAVHLAHELQVHQMELEIQNEELRRAQAELAASRDRYVDLYDFAPVGYLSMDPAGRITEANLAAATLLGVERARLKGVPLSRFVTASSQDAWYLHRQAVLEAGTATRTCVVELAASDGASRTVQLESGVVDDDGVPRCRTVLIDISALTRAEQALRRAHDELESKVRERTAELQRRGDQLARLASDLILTEKRERHRLAQMLHEQLQQILAGAKYTLDVDGGDAPEPLRSALQRVDELLMEAMALSRSLSAELSPAVLYERGLAAGLGWLRRRMAEQHGLGVTLRIDPDCVIDREDLRLLVFDAIREALSNVVRHAGTRQAEVVVERAGVDRLRATVSDAGRGFDTGRLMHGEGRDGIGSGLFGIRERLCLLGGELTVDSTPGTGTRVRLEVPVAALEARAPAPRAAPEAGSGAADTGRADGPDAGPERLRVLLVDDHRMVREGVAALLARAPDLVVVGQAADGSQAVEQARELRPDVILMDYSMPGLNGAEATRLILAAQPGVRVIGLSMFDEPSITSAMLDAGASAFMTKGGDPQALLARIREVARPRAPS